MTIDQVMTRSPATCGPDHTLNQALQIMWGGNCGCLPVVTGDGSRRLLGVVSDRDIYLASQFRGRVSPRNLDELRVRDAMVEEVRACSPADSLTEAGAIMEEAQVRLLPVVDRSKQLVGVLYQSQVAS